MIAIRVLLFVTTFLLCESCFPKKQQASPVDENKLSSIASDDDSLADTTIIRSHLVALTKTKSFRTHDNVVQLNETAEYIRSNLARYTQVISVQEYPAGGQRYKTLLHPLEQVIPRGSLSARTMMFASGNQALMIMRAV